MGLALVALVALAACGGLGWWQWTRAHERSTVLLADPSAPIAEVLAPAAAPERAVGRNVLVTGVWGAGRAVAVGRAVDDQEAVLLIRELTVDASATGTGERATLAVLVGWLPADEIVEPRDIAGTRAAIDGYLRISEAATPGGGAPPATSIPGVRAVRAVSAAELAQEWPGPLYAAVAVATDGTDQWRPMPDREPTSRLNLQSAVYAVEWWLFGAFAVVIAVRAMRENGRDDTEEGS